MTATPKEVQLLSNGAAIISTWIFNRRTPWWVSPFLGGSSKLGPILVQWALPGSRLHLMSSLEARRLPLHLSQQLLLFCHFLPCCDSFINLLVLQGTCTLLRKLD